MKSKVFAVFLVTAVIFLCAAGGESNGPDDKNKNPLAEYYDSLESSCQNDSDCVVLNVGNCCGYLPKCLNKAAKPDPQYVKALCQKNGLSSVCGFLHVTSCKCENNRCEAASQGAPVM